MPELIEYRQLPARSYPGFDRLSDRFVHYLTEADRVDLTPALAQVLFQVALAKRILVLGTTERAVLSPFVVHEMRRFGHRWCYQRSDGATCDAMSGQVITHWDQLLDPIAPGADAALPAAPPSESFAAVNLEVVGHHRAREDLVVGAMAEAFATCLGGANLDAVGMREPLIGTWSRSDLTGQARAQMPRSEMVRASSPDGAYVDLLYERDDHGVIERMNGRIVLGPWQEWASRASTIAESVMVQVTKLCTPVVMTSSLIDVESDGGQGIRRHEAERPLAWLAGPSSLKQAHVDVDDIAERYHGTLVGTSRPSLMVAFPANEGDPRDQLSRLLLEVAIHGVEQTAPQQRDDDGQDRFGDDGVRSWRPRTVE